MALRAVDQLGFDEETINDPDVEDALEDRLAKREAFNTARRIFEGAHDHAKAMIERLELPDPGEEGESTAVRVGRFRITKRVMKSRSVAFETKESVRLSIGLVDDEQGDDTDDAE